MPAILAGAVFAGLVRKDVDGDAGRLAHQAIDHRAVPKLEPAGPGRLADDELGCANVRQESLEAIDDIACRDARDIGAELRRQLQVVRELLALRGVKLSERGGFDVDRGPRRALRIGEALGGADRLSAPGSSLTATTIRSPAAQLPASACARR